LPSLAYLGQLDQSYLVCAGSGELVIVDLHGARELVTLRRLGRAHAERRLRPQRLLFPARLEAELALIARAAAARELLGELGFELSEASPTALWVRAAPAELPGAPEAGLRELLAELVREPNGGVPALLGAMACVIATRGAASVGPDEARALIEELDGAWLGHERPHGRPIIMRISVDDLARRTR
jgi:DNA mismatch repair protein MutL